MYASIIPPIGNETEYSNYKDCHRMVLIAIAYKPIIYTE